MARYEKLWKQCIWHIFARCKQHDNEPEALEEIDDEAFEDIEDVEEDDEAPCLKCQNDGIAEAALKHQLTEIKLELGRLRRHPQLFPSEGDAKGFWRDLQNFSKHHFDKALCCIDDIEGKFEACFESSAEEFMKQSFGAGDVHRTSWQRLLHNYAPNIPAGFNGSIQLLPEAGLRILAAYIAQGRIILADIANVSIHSRSEKTPS